MARTPKATPAPKAPPDRAAKTATGKPTSGQTASGINIRMYRLGIGDSFLVTLPKPDGSSFRLLIDCGVHTAEKDGVNKIQSAIANILETAEQSIDAIAGTHEHWDHLSGFLHGKELFKAANFKAKEIWCAWTEDLTDPTAAALINSRDKGVQALWDSVGRLRQDGDNAAMKEADWTGLFGFFGDSPGTGAKAKVAAEGMKSLVNDPVKDIIYRNPGEPPFDSISDQWRIFVLGPPRDDKALKQVDPKANSQEAYPLGVTDLAMAIDGLEKTVSPDDDPPFDGGLPIPINDTRRMAFFREHYWSDAATLAPDPDDVPDPQWHREEALQEWRRIDDAWQDGAEALALKLDKITNNTSLVLAIEIGPKTATDNPVLLFAADAQIGNWKTWQNVEWKDYAGRRVTGPDLLRRTVLYKVGHHASHNATLKAGGLETMKNLEFALVPTSDITAKSVHWGKLPSTDLLAALQEMTKGCVLRSDLDAVAAMANETAPDSWKSASFTARKTELYFDITFQGGKTSP
jgi:hypothetical protein